MAACGGKAPSKSLWTAHIAHGHNQTGYAGANIRANYKWDCSFNAKHTGCHHGHNAGSNCGRTLNNGCSQKTDKQCWEGPCCDSDYFLGVILTEFSSANCDEFEGKKKNKNEQQGQQNLRRAYPESIFLSGKNSDFFQVN